MIMPHNNDDIRPRRNYIKIKVKKPWELSTGHREHKHTVMDNRPKRRRTRQGIDKGWREDYDI